MPEVNANHDAAVEPTNDLEALTRRVALIERHVALVERNVRELFRWATELSKKVVTFKPGGPSLGTPGRHGPNNPENPTTE